MNISFSDGFSLDAKGTDNEMNSGYDNSACDIRDGIDHNSCGTTTMEMERVVVADAGATKCCGGSCATNQNLSDNKIPKTSANEINTNACAPKCPSVKASPWDPVKTRFAAVLTTAMVIWLLFGIFIVKC